MKILRCVALITSAVLPGIMNALLIPRKGLLILAATLLIETGLLLFRRLLGIDRRINAVHDWVQQFLSLAGIIVGIALFPVQSSPPELGIAAAAFAGLAHFLLYMIVSCIFFGAQKS